MILRVQGYRRPLNIDIPAAIKLYDDLRHELDELAGGKTDRPNLETGEPLPAGVEGIDPHIHVDLDATPTAVWPVNGVRVDPDLRTDRDQQDGRR